MKITPITCFALAAAVFSADQAAKAYIEQEPKGALPRKHRFLPITLHCSHNKGMFLNLLQEKPQAVSFLSASVLGFFCLCVCPSVMRQKGHPLAKTGAALMAGGALSNVSDHIHRGYVVDYFSLPVKKISHIVFNLGDFAILAGLTAFIGDHLNLR